MIDQALAYRRVGVVLCALLVSACGGGGGGDGGGGGGGGGTPSISGLVPAAPPPGSTLYADAAVLRPMVSAGVWKYRGVKVITGAQGTPPVYTNTITQQALPDGSTRESATDSDHGGPAEQVVSVRNGEVHATSMVDLLGNGQLQALDQLELRSPVRVDDQYVTRDSAVSDIGIDFDGDGRGESLDLAIYSRVVGEEFVDLTSYPQVRTLRVTTTIASRLRYSRIGTSVDAVGTLDAWYAPGIGIVKRQTDVPGPTGGLSGNPTREVTTESLVSWDGVTQGVGFLATRPATDINDTQLKRVLGAVGFGSHALVMTMVHESQSDGIVLSQLDGRGRATATYVYNLSTSSKLVRVGNAARVVTYAGGGLNPTGIQMYSFDATGYSAGLSPVVLKPGEASSTSDFEIFAVAGTSDALWIVWVQPPPSGGVGYTLQAQQFNAAGQPMASAQALGTYGSNTQLSNLRAEGASGHAIVAWDESTMAGYVARYSLLEGPGSPSVHTLVSGRVGPFGALPVATSSGAVAIWAGHGAGGRGVSGLTFDAAGEPRRSNALPIEQELLPAPWFAQVGQVIAVGGSSAALLGMSTEKLYPEDFGPSAFTNVADIAPGALPLASTPVRLLARGISAAPKAAVLLDNNVLMFSEAVGGVDITSVWRRP